MPVLYTLLGIILFFVILFSLKVTVIVDYGEKTVVKLRYLFITIPVVDTSKEKKEKKSKKEKKPKENKKSQKGKTEGEATTEATEATQTTDAIQTAEATEATVTTEPAKAEKSKNEKPEKQGNSLIKQLYLDHGYEGLEKMLRDLGNSLGGFFGKIYKTFTIDELYIKMVTAGGDAAATAIKHGKLCAWLYPVLGKLISTCKVKKYDFDISPDFLAPKSTASAFVRFHLRPIKITNGAVVLALQLVFKILFKILFSKKKSDKSKKTPKAVAKEVINSEATKQGENINK